ncbi:MAG: PD40 domain-containing protein [Candidatus Yanofskybacteria bacterium]|nr:PD40 domain-containing protein [Candidatus Yanofskybacteria bacterium]
MTRKSLLFMALIVSFFLLFPCQVSAQGNFGKNRVVQRKLNWQIYYSQHFAIRHHADLTNPVHYSKMQRLVALMESNYSRYSSVQVFDIEIKEKLPIVAYGTHSDLEGSALADPFLPEGVGAFVEWAQTRMLSKDDFEPQLFERIMVHELAHQFQMKALKKGAIGRLVSLMKIPNGFIEGGAEYLTGLTLPHTRDDIRDRQMRMMGSDIHFMPSWEKLMADQANGYVAWKMVYDFLDAKFGANTGVKFHVGGIRGKDIGLLIYQLSKGKLGNPSKSSELFNQEFFNYYTDLYEPDRAARPKPYQNTENFEGRNITPYNHPEPILSPVLCSSENRIAGFTIGKYGIELVTFPIPEEVLYSESINDKISGTAEYDEKKILRENGKKVITRLTKQTVPIPYEYLVNPFETWPKNGTHVSCSGDGRIAFFARTGRDHMLYIVENKEGGKILQKFELSVDQGFSPSFSPDGTKVYFSAASHSIFDIYAIDLKTGQVTNLTNDERYDTAPAASPNGAQLVYVGNDGDFNHLFMLNLDDLSKKQITFNRYNDSSPSWSNDGTQIVFTSDEKDKIWNLYTLDLAQNTRTQWWTPFFGGLETPMYASGLKDKVYFVVYRSDDTYRGQPYPNYEVFEAKLKKPVSLSLVVDNKESNIYNFDSDRFFQFQLDPDQVNKLQKPPEGWVFSASDVNLGGNTYYGIFGSSYFQVENFMGTKMHMAQFAMYGSFFKVINYTYLNQESRVPKGFSGYYNQYPLRYLYYDLSRRSPKNDIINSTQLRDYGVTFFTQYPRSKWTRFEFFSGFKNTKFNMGGLTSEIVDEYAEFFSDTDKQIIRLMDASSGPRLEAGIAVVRDTVIGSWNTQGPLHGNAFRAEVKAAPPIGSTLNGYLTLSGDARIYRKISTGTLLALRGKAMSTTRKGGEIMVMGGSDMFRGKEQGSIFGNELIYGSAELRFPFADGVIFPGGMGIGPFRGLLFTDAGIAKFHGEKFPAQKIRTYGFGIEMKPFQILWTGKKMVPSFYITFGW